MSSAPKKVWIIEPVARCVEFVAEEAKIGGLLQRALTHIEMGRPLLELLAQRFIEAGHIQALERLKLLLAEAPYQEEWARDLRNSGYSPLNAHGLVAIWGALEVCIEDTVVSILANDSASLERTEATGVKVIRDPSSSSVTEEEIRNVYRRLERQKAIKGNVVETYEAVLGFFGLSAACPAHSATLLEANALRNCIVHRGGFIDQKAASQVPILQPHVGIKYVVSNADFMRYHEAVSAWIVALAGSVCASPYASL